MQKKSKWVPPDSTALIFRVRKAIMDKPNAKYFQLRLFRAYKSQFNVNFPDNPMLNNAYTLEDKGKDSWAIVKGYLPINVPLHQIKEGTKYSKDNAVYDRVGVEIPDKFPVEIELPRVWFKKVGTEFRNHLLKNLQYVMKAYKLKQDGVPEKPIVYLTDGNWDIADREPTAEKTVMYNFKEGKPEELFECKPDEKPIAENAEKQESQEDSTPQTDLKIRL